MGRHSTGVVTAVDPLDFDDIGAKIGEDHGGRRPGHNGAEVQNTYACQWRGQRVEDSTVWRRFKVYCLQIERSTS